MPPRSTCSIWNKEKRNRILDDKNSELLLLEVRKNQIDDESTKYITECYNEYSKIRHKLLHFGDLDIDDTMTLSKESSQKVIIKTIELIAKYY